MNILKQFIIDYSNSLWAIGWIELHNPQDGTDKNSKEIGFVLSQRYWGQ